MTFNAKIDLNSVQAEVVKNKTSCSLGTMLPTIQWMDLRFTVK